MKKGIVSLIWSLLVLVYVIEASGQKSLFVARSQAVNSARELAGWQRLIYRPDLEATNVTMSIVPEYNHSFGGHDIARFLLGDRQLTFSGSQVVGRDSCDILADYFGLPSDFKSTIDINPTIVNFVMDFNWRIGLDSSVPGMYVGLHLPIVHTKWDLHLVECVSDPGMTFTSYPAGYFAATAIELSALAQGKNAPKNVTTVLQGNAMFGDMKDPLKYGKVFGRQSEMRVAELQVDLGYNFLQQHWYHFGIAATASAPTGTLRKSKWLFEPVVGNDHHWELGGVISGHVDFWHDDSEQQACSLYLNARITHLFASRQKRSFDLKNNGPKSRYILLQEIAAPSSGLYNGLAPDDEPALQQYQGLLAPAINITTLGIDVSIGVQADVVLKFGYKRRGFEFDLGYNLWARSREKCEGRECVATCYAVKGDAQIYGFTNPDEAPVALAATQSCANIYHGQQASGAFVSLESGNFNDGLEYANINADNIAFASDNLGIALDQLTSADANRLGIMQIGVRTSQPPILITNNDIDECSALMPKAVSHKLFTYIGYYLERSDLSVIPYIGFGAFVEFAKPDACDNSANSQWGLWLKMGVSYGLS